MRPILADGGRKMREWMASLICIKQEKEEQKEVDQV